MKTNHITKTFGSVKLNGANSQIYYNLRNNICNAITNHLKNGFEIPTDVIFYLDGQGVAIHGIELYHEEINGNIFTSTLYTYHTETKTVQTTSPHEHFDLLTLCNILDYIEMNMK